MTSRSAGDHTGLVGGDPFDVPSAGALRAPVPSERSLLIRRLALGWSATSIPGALLLLVGMALGPRGIGLLSPAVLSFLDPAVPVALAALGVLVGLGIGVDRPGDRRLLIAANLESGLTMLAVAAGALLVAPAAITSTTVPSWMLALVAGICAATSLTLPAGTSAEPRACVLRVVELDVVLPILAGGLILAAARESSLLAAVSLVTQACIVTGVLGATGWLLLARTSVDTEQRIFAIATLLLVGGAADYLSLSALLGGLIAGTFWQSVGGQARDCIRRDVIYVQHPLLVLVLLVAGARTDPSPTSLGLAVAYVCLRTAGKLAGGLIVKRVAGIGAPPDLGVHLISPGILGVAFALNAVRAIGSDMSVVLTVVVAGTIGAELLAGLSQPRKALE